MREIELANIREQIAKSGEMFDVIVAGGGPAGIGAAAAAALCGAKTLLLEEKAFFGGVAAVSGWMPFNRLLRHGKSRGGAVEKFVEQVQALGPDASRPGKSSWVDGDGLHIHPDYLRIAVYNLLEALGVKYRLHSPVTGVVMEGTQVVGVETDGKYGKATFLGKAFVDASGDGDVAYHAGAICHMGRETDGMFMPITLNFVVGNVDEEKLFSALETQGHGAVTDRIKDAEREGYSVSMFYSFDKTTVPGLISVNNGGQRNLGVVNAIDGFDVNYAERTALQVAIDFITICRNKQIPGLENCYLVRTGAALGVRETRRIQGEYVLTLEDAQSGKSFEDVVAIRYGTIDPGGLQENKDYHGSIKDGNEYPYGSMLPKGVEGLLVAGRCASLTHLGLTVCKSMGNMMAVGQGAGVAAALAALGNTTPRALNVKAIQQKLRDIGVVEVPVR